MNRCTNHALLFGGGILVLVIAAAHPEILSDKNSFLFNFVGAELLEVLGVILAITLGTVGQLHLTFNQIEERFRDKGGLSRVRKRVHGAAYCLIGLFAAAILVVVIKPLLGAAIWVQALFNGASLLILMWNILILISITQATFWVEPNIKEEG